MDIQTFYALQTSIILRSISLSVTDTTSGHPMVIVYDTGHINFYINKKAIKTPLSKSKIILYGSLVCYHVLRHTKTRSTINVVSDDPRVSFSCLEFSESVNISLMKKFDSVSRDVALKYVISRDKKT